MNYFNLVLLLAVAGCFPEIPGAREIDATAAVDLVMREYRYVGRPSTVYVVPDQHCRDFPGFTDPQNGRCVFGLTVSWYDEIYILDTEKYSDNQATFAHEMRHFIGRDHPDGSNWAWDSVDGRAISAANDALYLRPDIDFIKH